jgi:hypothetical protein
MELKINLKELLERDDKASNLEHAEQSAEKLGVLRAGNSGIMMEDGNFAGSCPRTTYLRLKGVDIPAPADRAVMFEFGRINETILIDKLKRTMGSTFVITGDDVNTVEWQTSSGRKVSGRPDIVVAQKDGKPLLVVEAKMCGSLSTVRDCRFGNKPKLAHICQAAHYGWRLDAPIKLVYIQSVDYATQMWPSNVKEYPKPGQAGSEQIDYTEKEIGAKGKKEIVMMPKRIKPGRTVYDVVIEEDGMVRYRLEGGKGAWSSTAVSIDAIVAFYEHVDAIESTQVLGPRPLSIDVKGDFLQWDNCSYCSCKPFCDSFETKLEVWFKNIKDANDRGELFS